MKLKKALKITRNILFGILIFILLFLLIVFVSDRILRGKEMKLLEENGYVNKVSVGEYSLNVFIYGSDTPEHTIVGMSGMGMDDFSCTGRYVTDEFSDKNRIVFVDRAGYGVSDDTDVPQTLDRIISDYRTALTNAGAEAPYVLMPHSIAGPYAAYWASEYPDEIEGILFIDGSPYNDKNIDMDDVDLWDTVSVIGSEIGLGRIYCALFGKYLANYQQEKDVPVSLALYHCTGIYSKAKYSEADLESENITDAWNKTKANDIPKMYISASASIDTMEKLDELLEYQLRVFGETVVSTDEERQEYITEYHDMLLHEYVEPYCEHVGSCVIRDVPGEHIIYCHKPEKVRECLKEFLEEIDKAEQ